MIICIGYRTIERGSLKGFCDLMITGFGFAIFDVSHHRMGDREWIGLPQKPYLGALGKVCWKPVLQFSPGARQASASFQRQALRAIRDAIGPEQKPASGQPRQMAPPI